jgi:hypothetical protein
VYAWPDTAKVISISSNWYSRVLSSSEMELGSHAVSMSFVFLVLLALAAFLEVCVRLCIGNGWVDDGGYIAFAMKFAARALATIDIATFLLVLCKRAWRLIKAA